MANFSSDADRKKWAALQNSAGASLSNIVAGKASTADFSKVATVLNGLNSLAAQVFAQAISAAEVQAKKFEAQSDKLGDALRLRDNDTLSAYEKALNQALGQVAPDIVESLREIIELQSIETNDAIEKMVGGKFSEFAGLLPQDPPSVDDLLAANQLLAEQISDEDERKWPAREKSLLDKIGDVFKSVIMGAAQEMRGKSSGAHQQATNYPRLAAPSADWELVDDHDVASQAMALVGGGSQHQQSPQALLSAPATANTTTGASTLPAGREGPNIALSEGAERQIQQAAHDQTQLYQKLLDFLKGGKDGGTGGSEADEEEEEEKKADTWWRSFRNVVGDAGEKYKKFKDENGGWLSALGKALALMIMDPQLFKYFGDQIEKYLTWDNVKSVVSTAWDWVSKQASSVVDWVMDKLGLSKKDDPMSKLTPEQKKKAQSSAADDAAAGGAYIPVAPQLDKNGKPVQQMGPPSSAMSAGADFKHSYTQGWEATKDLFGFGGNSSTTVGGPTVGGNRSSVVNNAAPTSTTNTVAVDANPVTMKPGTTTLPPGTQAAPSAPAGTGDNRPTKGAPQMGMSSFGFHTGIDDSLMMMNTPYFAG